MILDLIKKRKSVRKFDYRPISEKDAMYILEAGRLSASGGNEQSWKFGLIDDKSLIEKITEKAYSQNWIKSSPLLIVLCTEIVEDKRGGREIQKSRFPDYQVEIDEMSKDIYSYLNLEEHQTKIPGTQMVLAALEKEIYSTWVSCFNVKEVQRLLNLNSTCIPSEIIAFGYPAEIPKGRTKKNLSDVYFKNRFREI